jgi:ribose transport system substrate-binding protein
MTPTRRSFLLGTAAAAVIPGAACNRDRKKIIGVVAKGRSHIFWQSVHAGAVAAALENNLEILWNAPSNETEIPLQVQIVDTMINRRVDAIALAPIDRTALVSTLDRAAREKIPVVIFDSPIDSDKFVSQIATDNYRAGEIGAERLAQILGRKGKIAMVATQPGAASTMAREQGFEDTIAKRFPDIKIVDKRFGMSEVAKSLTVAENMLTAHPDLDGIFASNESSAVGAARALKGRNSKIQLVGFDSSPVLIEDLKAGVIDSLVIQNPFKMGYESIIAAWKTLSNQPVQKINNLEPRLVTRENLNSPEIQAQLNPDLKKYLE